MGPPAAHGAFFLLLEEKETWISWGISRHPSAVFVSNAFLRGVGRSRDGPKVKEHVLSRFGVIFTIASHLHPTVLLDPCFGFLLFVFSLYKQEAQLWEFICKTSWDLRVELQKASGNQALQRWS